MNVIHFLECLDGARVPAHAIDSLGPRVASGTTHATHEVRTVGGATHVASARSVFHFMKNCAGMLPANQERTAR